MTIIKKLIELGFELKENYYGNEAYVFRTSREDRNRFVHDFAYYQDENQFYINCHKMAGVATITEKSLIQDHNNLNTPAKEKWLEIKKQLEDYEFGVVGESEEK